MARAREPDNDAAEPTSWSLIRRVQAHDQFAWGRFVDLYSPLIYSWSRRAGTPAADAADVSQEVFLAVTQAVAGFRHDPERGTFRGWLRTITENKAREFARRRAGEVRAAGGNDARKCFLEVAAKPAGEPGETEDAREVASLYRRALEMVRGEFEPKTWTAFWRVAVDGVRSKDVVADLGVKVSVVYVARSRILARLREEFVGLVELDRGAVPARAEQPFPR
ncbi:MAG TPA: sigma-70 family RNA polymerase sigma factor [Gemmataceae bacterium]|nr:sigma-70 family RNA polymerase sigma factor [Gemmataceae bacterium]